MKEQSLNNQLNKLMNELESLKKQFGVKKDTPKIQSFDCQLFIKNKRLLMHYRKTQSNYELPVNCRIVFEDGELKSVNLLAK